MATGIGFFWTDDEQDCPDLVIENGQLKFETGLETSVFISAFSDRFVTLEQLPAGQTDQRGWWADLIAENVGDLIGSELWRLERSKTSESLAGLFEVVCQDMLRWMIDDGIAQQVTASATVVDNQTIEVQVTILKPDGQDIPFKFAWDGQAQKIILEAS